LAAIAAKKQHAASQATLGEIFGAARRFARRARGLALIILAQENAKADGKEAQWIGALYEEVLSKSDKAVRKDAEALLPALGGVKAAAVLPKSEAKPSEVRALPAQEAAKQPEAPGSTTGLGTGAPPPAPIGLSVDFGGTPAQGDFKP
jgi:hypothetical protein